MRKFLLPVLLFAVCLSAAAADVALPGRLKKAKVGEWLIMRDVSGADAGERMRISVAEVREGAPKVVVLKRERLGDDGSVLESKDMEIDMDRYAERIAGMEEKAKQISRERLTVKDKEFTVYAISWDDENDGETREFKVWVSEDLPVNGMAKFWCSDPEMPSAEVIDYGF